MKLLRIQEAMLKYNAHALPYWVWQWHARKKVTLAHEGFLNDPETLLYLNEALLWKTHGHHAPEHVWSDIAGLLLGHSILCAKLNHSHAIVLPP